MKKTGILGGTFNPVHNGHIALANAAYEALSLDKVLIMPTGVSYFKNGTGVLDKALRAKMVRLAIAGIPHFEFSDAEIIREGNTYTYETLSELTAACKDTEYYYITGADTVFSIETWKNPEIIFEKAVLAVMTRDDVSISVLKDKCEYLRREFGADYRIIDAPAVDISSSYIREMVCKGRAESIKDMVPPAVYEYIIENRLYV